MRGSPPAVARHSATTWVRFLFSRSRDHYAGESLVRDASDWCASRYVIQNKRVYAYAFNSINDSLRWFRRRTAALYRRKEKSSFLNRSSQIRAASRDTLTHACYLSLCVVESRNLTTRKKEEKLTRWNPFDQIVTNVCTRYGSEKTRITKANSVRWKVSPRFATRRELQIVLFFSHNFFKIANNMRRHFLFVSKEIKLFGIEKNACVDKTTNLRKIGKSSMGENCNEYQNIRVGVENDEFSNRTRIFSRFLTRVRYSYAF